MAKTIHRYQPLIRKNTGSQEKFNIPANAAITSGFFRNAAGEQIPALYWNKPGKKSFVRRVVGATTNEQLSYKLENKEKLTPSFTTVTFKK